MLFAHLNTVVFKVTRRFTQVRALFWNLPHKVIRDRHARIRILRLITNQRDFCRRISFTNCFSGNNACWASTNDHMLHLENPLLCVKSSKASFEALQLGLNGLQTETSFSLVSHHAICCPTTKLVVFRQHLIQIINTTRCRAYVSCILQ